MRAIGVPGRSPRIRPSRVVGSWATVVLATAACYASRDFGNGAADRTDSVDAPPDHAGDAVCVPECPAWRECGTDGCGRSCGTCAEGFGCGSAGVCVPAVCAEPRLVPAGEFVMGSDVDSYDQRPAQVVFVSTFRIGTYEATNGEWRACAAAGVCRPPERTTSPARTWPPVPYYDVPEFTHHPVTCMRNEQAALFCEWVGGRLPTEAEWEKAARGGYEMRAPASCGPEDEVLYPWGNAPPDCTLANYQPNTAPPEPLPEPCVGDADVAGARAAGASAYGVHDMAGNVREWVQDLYDPTWYRDDGPPWIDPTGPTEQWSHALQVDRGWNFGGFDQDIRVSVRHAATESLPWESCMGLRCAWPGE